MATDNISSMDLKSKRIVYQMARELKLTDVDDDFQNALLSMPMTEIDKTAGFNAFLRLQNDIKESLKNFKKFGKKDEMLSLLSSRKMKNVSQMLETKLSQDETFRENENGDYFGERIVAKKVQVVEDSDEIIPKVPNIPPLQVDQLYDDDFDESEDLDWADSQRGRPSSRIPDVPMEPLPKIPSERSFADLRKSEPSAHANKKIVSRARPIEKVDAQIQTDDVKTEEIVKVHTADSSTNCRLLVTPRVEEVYDHFESDSLRIVSPMSTVFSDVSEGEVTGIISARSNIIAVRSDGSIVQRPKVLEEVVEETHHKQTDEGGVVDGYWGDSEPDILRAASSSPLRVREIDLSSSSIHTQ